MSVFSLICEGIYWKGTVFLPQVAMPQGTHVSKVGAARLASPQDLTAVVNYSFFRSCSLIEEPERRKSSLSAEVLVYSWGGFFRGV